MMRQRQSSGVARRKTLLFFRLRRKDHFVQGGAKTRRGPRRGPPPFRPSFASGAERHIGHGKCHFDLLFSASRKDYLSFRRLEGLFVQITTLLSLYYILLLLNGHALGEVTRLIDVRALQNCHVVCQQLERDGVYGRRLKVRHVLGHLDHRDALARLQP